MNDVQHKDFIAYYRNLFPQGYCQHLINEFERLEAVGVGANRQRSENAHKHVKDDHQINMNLSSHHLERFNDNDPVKMFFDGLQSCYDEYTGKYSILRDNGRIRGSVMKMQRTTPGGGYHVWHGEQGPNDSANRVLVYMIYLNTLLPEDGAETEFLYQKTRVAPEENMMILWPASYTHAHRGNPVLGETNKYIVTGWFYYD